MERGVSNFLPFPSVASELNLGEGEDGRDFATHHSLGLALQSGHDVLALAFEVLDLAVVLSQSPINGAMKSDCTHLLGEMIGESHPRNLGYHLLRVGFAHADATLHTHKAIHRVFARPNAVPNSVSQFLRTALGDGDGFDGG